MWASLIVDVYVEREGVFVLLVMMGLLGVVVVVGVGLVSIMDEIVRLFPTSAEQTSKGHGM